MIKRGQKRLISLLVSLLLVPASLHLSQTAVLAKNSEGNIRENDQQIAVDNKNGVVKNQNYTIFFKQNIKSDDINVFLQKLSSLAIKYKEKHRFNTLFKAVTLEFQELSEKQLAMLKKYSEVDEIINDHTYLPLVDDKSLSSTRHPRRQTRDASSAELINLPKLSPDTDGRGTLVAVIDSGADVASPDLRLDDEVVQNRAFKYDQATMKKIIKDNGLDGIWYSDKLPYVYNYAESKTDVGGKGIEHGMHVAGIIGANPLAAKDLYARGVIPNAQLAIMRVFGRNKTRGTSSYIYLRALEDAYKIGVDAVNMSLGISAGSTSTEDTAVIKAIEELKKKGVQVAIAGGNDGYFGHNYGRPRTDMPDYGVVASPGVLEDSLTVASLENTKYKAAVFEAKGLKQDDELSYILHGTINHDELLKDEHYQTFRSIVDCGYGQVNDFPANTSLKGKIAMIKRGKGLYFSTKIKNALVHEADFVMFVNDPGDNSVPGIEVGDAKVISTIILRSDADMLLAKKAQLRLANENIEMNNPTAGKLSEFSAWGFTADGQLKPDITAPGGKIWSDVGDGKRESLSGTSMATPHVAAALAIVAKRVTNDFPHIQGEAKQALIKQLLMNTAVPHLSNDGHTFSSPRQQGAGVLNVTKALQANTVAYGTNGLASINLGNVKDRVHIDLIVENKGSKPVTYNYKTYFTTDKIIDGRFMAEPLSLGMVDGTSLTLEAGAKKIITIDKKVSELKMPSHDIAPQGCYIDGFVVLSSADNPELSIPFSGFVGDWTNLPVIEPSIYDLLKVGRKPFYLKPQEEKYKLKNRPLQHGYGGSLFNFTHLETLVDNEFQVLGAYPGIKPNIYYSDKHLAISPNDDGRNDYAAFRATFLRSYTDCQIKVYKEKEKTPIYTGAPVLYQGYKNYAGSDEKKQSSSSSEWSWHGEKDGTDRKVADGKYEFEVTVKPLADGAKEQTMRFPLTVDTIAPEVKSATWDATKRIFDLQEVIEKGSGLRLAQIIYPENNSVLNHRSLNTHLKAKEEVGRLQVLKGQHGHIDLPNTNNKAIRTPQGKIINASEVNGDHHKFVLPKEVDFDKAKLLLEDWAGNLYYQPLNASIRDDKFRIIPRVSLQGDGILPAVKIEIFDEHNKPILANQVITAGRYRIHASLQNDDYQLKTPQDQWVEINETNKNAIVNIIVEKVKYYKVTVAIDGLFDDKTIDKLNLNGYKGKVTIKLINQQTKRQYLFKQTLSLIKDQLDVLVPAGEYDVSIEDIADGWQAKASTTKLTVIPRTKPHGSGIDLSVKYAKKEAPRIKFYLQPSTDNTYTDTLIKPVEFVFTNLTTSEKTTLNYNLESGAKTAELPEGNYQVTITEPKDYELKIADAIDNKVNIKLDKFGISGPTIRFSLTKKASGKIEPAPSEKKVKLYISYSLFFSDHKDISNKPIKLEFKNNANGKTKEITYAKAGQMQSELAEGEYTVKLLEPKGYSLELNGDKQNHKLVVKYNEKFGMVQTLQMYFALHKEEQAPSPLPSKEGDIWLEVAAANEYPISTSKPIKFVFEEITSHKKINKEYGSVHDYKVSLPYGTYKLSVNGLADYELNLPTYGNENIVVNDETLKIGKHISIPFALKHKKQPAPSEKKVKLYISYSLFFSDYKDISNKPIKLEFKNNANGKTKEITYAKAGQMQSELAEGEYTVKLLEPKGYSLELNGDKQNHKLVVKYNEKFGMVQPVQMYFALHKEEQAPSPLPSKEGDIWLEVAAANEYPISTSKPIKFVFEEITSHKKINKEYGSVHDYKVSLPYGTYKLSVNGLADYELNLPTYGNENIVVNDETLKIGKHISIPFALKHKKQPAPSEKKVKLYINYSLFFSDYKDISNKPIKLEFKNNANGKTKEITYAKAGQLQSELTEGEYTVKLLEPKGYSLELNGDKQNHKLVVKYNEKFGMVQPVQMYFALHKEEQAPSPSIAKYHLTIINGHIICDDRSSEQINTVEVKAGEVVKVIADIPTNMIFTGWQVKKGNLQLENKDIKIINFKMPKEDIELVATFKSNHVDHNQTPSQIHTDTNTTPTLSSTSNNRVNANVEPKTGEMYSGIGVSLVLFFSLLCLVFIYRFSLTYSTNIDLDDITINDIHHHKNRRNDK